jgi:AraC-like DNA-binding protein
MRWSLSEFLNLLHARSQCWGFVELGTNAGFRMRTGEAVMFYTLLEGTLTISGLAGEPLLLRSGETAIVLSGAAHALRVRPDCQIFPIQFLNDDEYGDVPHHVSIGCSAGGSAGAGSGARVLCGRLKVRWPGGVEARSLPGLIQIKAADQIINIQALAQKARGPGSAALLTHAAAASLIEGLREHPRCQAIFRDANFGDPILRAVQYMELHMHREWTVGDLAAKVGMARSTFAGRFLTEVGKAPMAVLTELRMERAAGLVSRTRLKLAEIGERVGYHSLSAFSRRFETHFHITPGKMRAANKASVSQFEARDLPEAQGQIDPFENLSFAS